MKHPKHSAQKSRQSTDSQNTNEDVFVKFEMFCVLFGFLCVCALCFILCALHGPTKHCLPRGQLLLTLRGYLFTRSKLLSFARV